MDLKNKIKQYFAEALPGNEAHKKFSPAFRDEQIKFFPKHKYEAAVSIILFEQDKQLKVIFIRRVDDGGPHSRQIAFPGGTKEIKDKSLLETAYRELLEEIGIEKNNLDFIKLLTTVYIPVSQYLVYPFVFYLNDKPKIIKCEKEVENVYLLNVKDFFYSDAIAKIEIAYNNKIYEVPCYKVNDIIIWGATAMIWSECLTMLKPLFENV